MLIHAVVDSLTFINVSLLCLKSCFNITYVLIYEFEYVVDKKVFI